MQKDDKEGTTKQQRADRGARVPDYEDKWQDKTRDKRAPKTVRKTPETGKRKAPKKRG